VPTRWPFCQVLAQVVQTKIEAGTDSERAIPKGRSAADIDMTLEGSTVRTSQKWKTV
jgi:hypothetical protein